MTEELKEESVVVKDEGKKTKELKEESVVVKAEGKKKAKKRAPKFNYDDFFIRVSIPKDNNDARTGVIEKDVFKEMYQGKSMHLTRCRIRCARAFDITLKHLEKAYAAMNMKKLDGVYINDIIHRYGYADGIAISRPDLAAKNNINSYQVEVLEKKVKDIFQAENPLKEWATKLKAVKDELENALKEKSVFGEK